jgi:hypothetical protein
MEVAPASSEFNAKWGVWDHDVADPQESIGSGKRNTELIIEKLNELGETGRAAQMCRELNVNGFSGWFLPSKDEQDLMFVNLHNKFIGDFGKGTNTKSWVNWSYWSSSQVNVSGAWGLGFYGGIYYYNLKIYRYRVRAVRVF